MVDQEVAERIVASLNDMLEHDRNAIACLVANRIPCNVALADHPTVQVGSQHGGFHVGMLGVLNGITGSFDGGPKSGWGGIAAIFEDDVRGPEYEKTLDRFEVVKNE